MHVYCYLVTKESTGHILDILDILTLTFLLNNGNVNRMTCYKVRRIRESCHRRSRRAILNDAQNRKLRNSIKTIRPLKFTVQIHAYLEIFVTTVVNLRFKTSHAKDSPYENAPRRENSRRNPLKSWRIQNMHTHDSLEYIISCIEPRIACVAKLSHLQTVD